MYGRTLQTSPKPKQSARSSNVARPSRKGTNPALRVCTISVSALSRPFTNSFCLLLFRFYRKIPSASSEVPAS